MGNIRPEKAPAAKRSRSNLAVEGRTWRLKSPGQVQAGVESVDWRTKKHGGTCF